MVIKFQIGKALVKSEALLNAIAGAAAASARGPHNWAFPLDYGSCAARRLSQFPREKGRAVTRSSHGMQRAPLHVVVISQGVPPAAAAGCGGPVVGSCFDHLLLKCCSFIRSVTVLTLLLRCSAGTAWQRQRQSPAPKSAKSSVAIAETFAWHHLLPKSSM
jgi:hypothetical protein